MAQASDRLLAARERIMALWEQRIRAEIPAAAEEEHPILIDTLPAVLHQLAQALSPRPPRAEAPEGSSRAEEPGGERVRVPDSRLEDLLGEYKILREVLVEVLEPMTD